MASCTSLALPRPWPTTPFSLENLYIDKDIAAQKGTKSEKSKLVGAALARKATELGVKEVVFDRGGYLYHGRVKSVADGAREGGLQF